MWKEEKHLIGIHKQHVNFEIVKNLTLITFKDQFVTQKWKQFWLIICLFLFLFNSQKSAIIIHVLFPLKNIKQQAMNLLWNHLQQRVGESSQQELGESADRAKKMCSACKWVDQLLHLIVSWLPHLVHQQSSSQLFQQ